jgi:DNA-binding NarL/FixJ family response regulator
MVKRKMTFAEYLARSRVRRRQILRLLERGLPQTEIARKLKITQPRVSQIAARRHSVPREVLYP